MLKLMPMNIYDVAAQQARMEDQAARGWFAVSVPGIFFLAVFEKGEPKAVRYRLEPAPVKESCPDPERLAAYQSMGWEYVDTSGKSMHPVSYTHLDVYKRQVLRAYCCPPFSHALHHTTSSEKYKRLSAPESKS